jgi:hypothetical protein
VDQTARPDKDHEEILNESSVGSAECWCGNTKYMTGVYQNCVAACVNGFSSSCNLTKESIVKKTIICLTQTKRFVYNYGAEDTSAAPFSIQDRFMAGQQLNVSNLNANTERYDIGDPDFYKFVSVGTIGIESGSTFALKFSDTSLKLPLFDYRYNDLFWRPLKDRQDDHSDYYHLIGGNKLFLKKYGNLGIGILDIGNLVHPYQAEYSEKIPPSEGTTIVATIEGPSAHQAIRPDSFRLTSTLLPTHALPLLNVAGFDLGGKNGAFSDKFYIDSMTIRQDTLHESCDTHDNLTSKCIPIVMSGFVQSTDPAQPELKKLNIYMRGDLRIYISISGQRPNLTPKQRTLALKAFASTGQIMDLRWASGHNIYSCFSITQRCWTRDD